MEHLHELIAIKHDFITWLHRDAKECCQLDDEVALKAAGEVADIIKDLASAEKDCLEAEYYRTVIDAMHSGEEPRYGYNRNRYKNGHYAPKGHGHMSGYRPYMDQEPYINAYLHHPDFKKEMMGYSEAVEMDDYASTYMEYAEAKDHYAQMKTKEAKDMMDAAGKHHVEESLETIKEIYMNADPEHKKHLKMEVSKIVSEMPV